LLEGSRHGEPAFETFPKNLKLVFAVLECSFGSQYRKEFYFLPIHIFLERDAVFAEYSKKATFTFQIGRMLNHLKLLCRRMSTGRSDQNWIGESAMSNSDTPSGMVG